MEFKCNHCTNVYKSYQSRWNHIKRVHNICDKSELSHDKSNDKSNDKSEISHDKSNDKSNDKYELSQQKNYKCSFCQNIYKHYQSRWKHEKICKSKESINQKIINNNTTNNNNGIININNSQKIINNFGSNNLECLTDNFKKKLLKEFLFEEDYVNPIPLVIEKINFNSDYKENNNAKISNLRSKIGYKYTDGRWKAVEKEKLLNELVKTGEKVIDDYMDDLEHIPQNVQDGYDDYFGKKELLIKQIKTKIEFACYLYFKNIEDENNKEIEI